MVPASLTLQDPFLSNLIQDEEGYFLSIRNPKQPKNNQKYEKTSTTA